MYTLYSSVTRSIPTTSYMKAVEWWLLFHITGPFIIFNVIFLKEHKHKKKHFMKQDIDKKTIWIVLDNLIDGFVLFGKFVLPVVTILFVLLFSVIVLFHY